MNIDNKLPWLLQKKHIAHIEGDHLLIGDRRRYPWEHSYVACSSVAQIAQAIAEMVTQGGGPLQVGLTTMRFLAKKIEAGHESNALTSFASAVELLAAARPTNTTMRRTLKRFLKHLQPWYANDSSQKSLITFVGSIIDAIEAGFDADYQQMSDHGSLLITNNAGILTTCFAEHTFILSLIKAREQGKSFTVYVPETRPYLQGARLTAPALVELGLQVQLITDGMGAHFMGQGAITHYMTAADVVAMDGTVVNKTGTLANAICAQYYQIPYTVFAMSPDPSIHTASDIVMEERNGKEVLYVNGKLTTLESITGRYPAFDCIDPALISHIITPKGLAFPHEIDSLYGQREK